MAWRRLQLLWSALAVGSIAAMPAQAVPRVEGISAYLLSSKSGTLSPDVLRTPELLGNAVLYGKSLLVVIKISKAGSGSVLPSQRVRLVATEGTPAFAAANIGRPKTRLLLDRSVRMGVIGADATTHVGFWLDDIGCAPVALDISLIGGARTRSRHEVVGFQCYE